MRTIGLAIVLAACGGKRPVVKAPPSDEAAKVTPAPDKTAPAPVETASAIDVFGRLGDADGPVPGLEAVSTRRQPDPTRCGGIQVVVTRDPDQRTAIDDADFLALYQISFPTHLDFTDGPARKASLERFDQWIADLSRLGAAARAHYGSQTQTASETGRVIAGARLVQIERRVASLLVRAEIPVDVRTGEFAEDKKAAFCAQIANAAETMLAGAAQAETTCAEHAKTLPPGWWTAVCSR